MHNNEDGEQSIACLLAFQYIVNQTKPQFDAKSMITGFCNLVPCTSTTATIQYAQLALSGEYVFTFIHIKRGGLRCIGYSTQCPPTKVIECEGHLICMQTSTLNISLLTTIAITIPSQSTGQPWMHLDKRKRKEREEKTGGGRGYARRRRSGSYVSCGYRGKGPGDGEPGAYNCCCPCPLDPASPTNSSGSSPDRKYRSMSDGSNSEEGTGEGADVRGG